MENIIAFVVVAVVVCMLIKSNKNKKEIKDLPRDNSKYNEIVKLIQEGKNVFITGGAGTGKSYTLNKLKEQFKERLHLTSTTGISAINIKGQTIHSWAGIGIANRPLHQTVESIKKNGALYKQILLCKMLAIDEISMLRGDVMEYINQTLKFIRGNEEPFGGIQIILIGDFFQLPPVSEASVELKELDFCFKSKAWKELNPSIVLLEEVKRQSDPKYIQALNSIREGKTSASDLIVIWEREELIKKEAYFDKDKLHLFATNKEADNHNRLCLNSIDKPSYVFGAEDRIDWCTMNEIILKSEKVNEAFYETDAGKGFDRDCRAPRTLELKEGCRVMLLKNLDVKAELANGSCGTVTKLKNDYIEIQFDCGIKRAVSIEEYELTRVMNHRQTGASKRKIVRKQYPLRLAYGITIHKSQGMTFDELVVHCDKIFAEGQAYVALSRTRKLEGLYPISFDPNKVIVSEAVIQFYESFSLCVENSKTDFIERKKDLIKQAIVQHKEIKITYKSNTDFSTGETTQRIILPYKLEFGEALNALQIEKYTLTPTVLYLKGFCRLRNEPRTFVFSRIDSIEIVE